MSRRVLAAALLAAAAAGGVVYLLARLAFDAVFGPVVCADGWESPSIGIRGACSHHGGVDWPGPTYALAASIALAALAAAATFGLILRRAILRSRRHAAARTWWGGVRPQVPVCPQCHARLRRLPDSERIAGRAAFACPAGHGRFTAETARMASA